ncbi:uncharacterized protein LOC103316107 [Nasonia vitripennis]|uniref:Chromo domain-containing protein n=1 Tax=Nasonia vitripennis TaxID=7425 RepID=A0A7M7H4A1_NASVI|nr:uncharacterized protein LOC103316107 [Nasonia vitripennis]
MRSLDEVWKADLVEMQPYAQENKGYKYLLTVIDVFSKNAWAVPLKQKTRNEVAAAMKSVLDQGRVPKNLHTDREYNNSKHRTIGIKPKDVSKENEAILLIRFSRQEGRKKSKFKVGDKARVSKMKQVFKKAFTPNWSTAIFTISQVVPTYPVQTYKLEDYQDQPIAGGFYEQELLKAKHLDIYLVEKVLKKRGNQLYVKWLGFDDSHNSWINKSDL